MQINTEKQKNQVIKQINRKYQDLYENNLQLQQTLNIIEKEAEKQRIARESSEERKERRKKAM